VSTTSQVSKPTTGELTANKLAAGELTIEQVEGHDSRLRELLTSLKAELDLRYPEETGFKHPEVHCEANFLLGRIDQRPVGCCAVQLLPAAADRAVEAELKRMFVVPECRRQRIAERILHAALALAGELGARRMKLETGIRQPEAIALYERTGFTPIPTYPPFDVLPTSRCYALDLNYS
jgi:putative acetyltransferase